MKKAIVFLADGFEEIEALTTVDLLRRAGIVVETASIMEELFVTGAHDVAVKADVMAENAGYEDADIVILPGGGEGTQNLGNSSIVKDKCIEFAAHKMCAAICAAPTVLASIGILEGKKATCYPGMEAYMHGASCTGEMVVVDGNIITGRAPGAAAGFALELIKQLLGVKAAEIVREGAVINNI